MAVDKPLLGRGAGNYFTSNQPLGAETAAREVVFGEGGTARKVPLHVVVGAHHPVLSHNDYLDNAAEGGAVGLAFYCVLVLAPLIGAFGARRAAGRERPLLDAFTAVYAAWLATNAVTQNMYFADFAPHFWILAGMLAASGLRVSQEDARERPWPLTARWVAVGAAVLLACDGVWFLGIRPYVALRRYQEGCLAYSVDKDFPRARDLLRWAADNAGNEQAHIWALDMLGYTYLARGDEYLQSAHSVFREINGKVEGYDHFGEGLSHERSGLYGKAVAAYEVHRRMRPADGRTQQRLEFCRMMAALAEGRGDEAAAAAREYFARYPDEVSERRIYFKALLETGPAPMAELGRMAGEFEDPPTDPLDKFLIGRFRLLGGDAESAIALMEEAHRLGYRGPGINRWRTVAYIRLERYEDAWKVLQTGRRANPTCKNLIVLEKDLRKRLGKTDDASERDD
jgi:tetratricopeptide (TPR) repeat protein